MKNFLFTLFFGLFIFANSYSQVIVMDIVQVKEGMNAQYEAVEKFVEPIKREAVKMGKQLGWYIMKRKSGGDLSEVENKGIGDYIILNIFEDEAQMKSGMDWNATANKVYKGKMSARTIQKKMNSFILLLINVLNVMVFMMSLSILQSVLLIVVLSMKIILRQKNSF